jgi:hypothetical protein
VTRYREVNPLSPIAAAYIAGIVDGEGTITLSRKHPGEGRQLVINVLAQIRPFLRSYKSERARLVEQHYIRLTPRNGKYTAATLAARQAFEGALLALRANGRCTPL